MLGRLLATPRTVKTAHAKQAGLSLRKRSTANKANTQSSAVRRRGAHDMIRPQSNAQAPRINDRLCRRARLLDGAGHVARPGAAARDVAERRRSARAAHGSEFDDRARRAAREADEGTD